ncbi:hypothetical protein J2Y45_005905 [Dyadobacter sp. BE34]|uniref:3-keto-disaccharide hydrolase domain-containing protein n=1 Tax=Dyadobacter fermentans TaxID=94254 RepID=A0ABU1R5M7_9BACT|nr:MULTISPECIES: hypothetical protein [Dyadobacter]MDR6808693.1 hypothetical protein [Dyadobacter fermentans]MDR7046436.1 hypothetical protein [Dyadobacter sp. BE242]MDR7200749.1 hypothetical protein [Dyadobacter sp. BE34]MDR7218709.1 hypothetical protein [Dyadobacter sp. BE31]MDR7266639.1 hypothetical protein [Dyadobacter sp. BE32]
MKKITTTALGLSFALSCLLTSVRAQDIALKPALLTPFQVTVAAADYKGKSAIALEMPKMATNEKTLAVLKGMDFHNGTIEATISGQPQANAGEGARGFVGIAFRVAADTSKMELFYIRPTNGRANDQVRRNHSTQYVSMPGFPWEKLRKETPEKYEAYADMVPAEWTKVKIEVKDETAKLYINGASQPALIVNDLKQGKDLRGSVGLWIGPGSLGHFTDLKVTKLD